MKAKNKLVKFLCVAVLAGMLLPLFTGCGINDEYADEKAAIEAECKRTNRSHRDIRWYDESINLDFSMPFYRIMGTYGDCIVILTSTPPPEFWEEPPLHLIMTSPTQPEESNEPFSYDLKVLDRTITCPAYFELLIYNPNVVPPEDSLSLEASSIRGFGDVYEDEWLTVEQKHQVLDDLEKWIAEKT